MALTPRGAVVAAASIRIRQIPVGGDDGDSSNNELREDGGLELREDGGTELRE